MTLNELIERLEEIRDDYGVSGESQVHGAFQPNYPLVTYISAITTIVSDDVKEAGVYIALGDGTKYGLSDLWDDELVERESDEDEDE